MTERKLDLGRLTIEGKSLAAGLDELVSGLALSWRSEQVAELAVSSHDVGGRLAATRLGTLGSRLVYGDDPWQVAAIDAEWANDNVEWTFRARSELARKLRKNVKVAAEKNQSAGGWVTGRVKAAGGTAVVQGSVKKAVIAQGNDQSDLDVIANLASQLGWSWTEWGGRLFFGSRWWAWKDGVPGLATYDLTWGRDDATDALSATAILTEDDSVGFGSMQVTVPYPAGKRLRPWQRMRLAGFGRFSGVWLVDAVTWRPDGVSPVEVELILPKKPVPQPAGGSSPAGNVPATGVRAAVVSYALAQVGKPYSYTASPPSSWDCSKLTAYAWNVAGGLNLIAYTWDQVKQCRQIGESEMLPGDLIFYFRDMTNASKGHVAMFIGNGQLVEASSPSSGVRTTSLHNSWSDAHVSGYYRPIGAPDS